MRRLFGLGSKEKKETPPLPSTAPPADSSPPPPPDRKPNPGLGLTVLPDQSKEEGSHDAGTSHASRRSRHVQWGEQPHAPIHSQASFESRHGSSGAASNCFPGSSKQSSESSLSEVKPGPPKPVVGSLNGAELQRTISPLSFSGSYGSSRASPYGYGYGAANPSLSRLAERDPSQILAPLTWSELAQKDLVENVSERERIRQEILWEVVSSEERYVVELRSLVENYVNPLLHPLLSPPSSPPLSTRSATPTHYSKPSPTPSREELPIAARFLRSIGQTSEDSTSSARWDSRREAEMPEIESESSLGANRSRQSLPPPPRPPAPQFPNSPSAVDLVRPDKKPSRLASIPGFRPRHPLRPEHSAAKLLKSGSKMPPEASLPPPLPEGLRSVLEVIPDMLKGHEELSNRLKDQWTRAFPLVRGLALIWSDQPWFLDVYAKYVVSLEDALETIDKCLPSNHSPHQPLTLLGKPKSQADKETKRLARFIMTCEESASLEGEASLAIAISKPLMRLGKLPLLMQSLLYHTDATTVEYEKTRAMALEVDALVRSIEDEKVDEEEREKVRDVLARIEGIKDKSLMAPRSSRVLIEEVPFHEEEGAHPTPSDQAPRRAVSDSAPIRSSRGASTGPSSTNSKKSVKRMSDVMGGGKRDDRKDWLIRFSDLTIRCAKTGTTDIPGGFSREKEKHGKQGKTKKKGKTRNLYRFIRVEQREMREMTSQGGFVNMDEIGRSRTNVDNALVEAGEDERLMEEEEEEDDDSFDGVSRMSFSYEADDPKPVAPRNFKDDFGRPTSRVSARSASSATRNAVSRQTPAKAKFGGRLPASSLGPAGRYQAPTAASLARASGPSRIPTPGSRVVSPSSLASGTMPAPSSSDTAPAPAKRGLSSPAMPSSTPPSARTSSRGSGLAHSRDDSTLGVYQAFWKDDTTPPIPFPRS